MHRLRLPAITAEEAYARTISAIRNRGRRAPYIDSKTTILALCATFDKMAKGGYFHLAVPNNFDVDGLDGSQMVALYDDQFSNRISTKSMRDAIKNAAPHRECPYCGQGYASELDHYLPKALFSGTTVHPANLVPACTDCNFAKRAYTPGISEPAVLHPYFDTALDIPWLVASIALGALNTPVITFEAKLATTNVELQQRLDRHLKVFKLHHRFGVWAAQALENFQLLLASNEGRSMTQNQARQHLRRNAISLSGNRVNTWEYATYTAMANSDWYLQGYLHLRA